MDPPLPAQSPDKSDMKPSFRKPLNDAVNRKYRRHSPGGGSPSSSSDGGPNHERSRSPVRSMDDRNRMSEDQRRKDDGKDLERGSGRYLSSRASDSYRHPDRSTRGSSHDHRRHNDYSRYEKHADEEGRNYQRSSRSGRELSGTRYDHTRHDNNSDKSRDNWRDVDKHHRVKSENYRHKERETIDPEHHRFKDKDSEKVVSDIKNGERERYRDREARDDRRGRIRSPDYRNDHVSSRDSVVGRDSGGRRSKENHSSSNKEMDGQKNDLVLKRKHDDRDIDKRKEKHAREPEETRNKSSSMPSYCESEGKHERYTDKTMSSNGKPNSLEKKFALGHSEGDEKPSSSSKQVMGTAEIVTSKPANSITNQAEAVNDLDAAKVAAMRAAELVNRNLVGGSYLSTDQKKKLLWGNKKSNTTAEEPSNRWDLHLFPDRERQEKFNKLMGVKGEAVPERKPDEKDGGALAEKQREQLNMDLEKQYTAGLRRRDGRTVGLGL